MTPKAFGWTITDIVWRYEMLGIAKLQTYQPIRTLPADAVLGKLLKPQYFKTACVRQFFYSPMLSSNSFSSSSIVGSLDFRFSGIESVNRYSLIPIGLFISLKAYSTSILSLLLHNNIPM